MKKKFTLGDAAVSSRIRKPLSPLLSSIRKSNKAPPATPYITERADDSHKSIYGRGVAPTSTTASVAIDTNNRAHPTETGLPVVTPKASNKRNSREDTKVAEPPTINFSSSHNKLSDSELLSELTNHESLKLQLRDASRVVRAILGVDGKLDGNASLKAIRKFAAMKKELKSLRNEVSISKKQLLELESQFLAEVSEEEDPAVDDSEQKNIASSLALAEDNFKQQLKVLQDLVEERELEVKQLQADLEKSKSASPAVGEEGADGLRRLLNESHEEIEELEHERQLNMQEIVDLSKQLLIAENQKRVQELERMCQAKQDRVDELEQERSEYVSKIEELTGQLEDSQATVAEVHTSSEEQREMHSATAEQRERTIEESCMALPADKELEDAEYKMTPAKNDSPENEALQNSMRDQAAKTLVSQLLDRDAKLERVTLELNAKVAELESLKQTKVRQSENQEPMEAIKNDDDSRIQELEAEFRDNQMMMTLLADKLNKSSVAVENLVKELGEIRQKDQKSKTESESLRNQLEEARAKAEAASKDLESVRSTEGPSSSEIELLTSQLEEALASVDKLSSEVEHSRASQKARAKERNDLMGQLVISRAVQESLTNAVAQERSKEETAAKEMRNLSMSRQSEDEEESFLQEEQELASSNLVASMEAREHQDSRLLMDELLELRNCLQEAQMEVEELEQERNYNLAKVYELNQLLDIDKADDATKKLHAKAMQCASLNTQVDKLTADLQECNVRIEKLEQERQVYKAKVEELSEVWDTHMEVQESERKARESMKGIEKMLEESRTRVQQLERERDLTIEKAAGFSIDLAESRAKVDDLSEQLEYERGVSKARYDFTSSRHSVVSTSSRHSTNGINLIEPLDEEDVALNSSVHSASGRRSSRIFPTFGRSWKHSANTILDETARIRDLEAIVARQESRIAKLRAKDDTKEDSDGIDGELVGSASAILGGDADAAAGAKAVGVLSLEQAQELTIQCLMKQIEKSDVCATREPPAVQELQSKLKTLEKENSEYCVKVKSLEATLEEVGQEKVETVVETTNEFMESESNIGKAA